MLKDFQITDQELSELEQKIEHGRPAQFDLVQDKLIAFNSGLITFDEMQEELSNFRIYGAIDGSLDLIKYIGYDYANQQWIEVDLNR